MQVTAVVLAGGRATRMGGVDKGLVAYEGQRLIDHVLARIAPQVDHVIINANRNLDTYRDLGLTVVMDANQLFDGPLAGMQAGLHHATTDWLMSVPCDAPLLPLDVVQRLYAAAHQEKTQMAVARSASGTHPVICLMHRSLQESLNAFLASGQRKVSAWQAQHHPAFADFEEEQAFTNINQLPLL